MKRELRIGIFVGAALVVMAVFIFIVGDLSLMFRKTGYTVTVDFDSAAGLESRTVVKMSGVKIGYIEDIKLAKRKARVTLSIFAGVEIPKDSKAAAASLGLLGEKYLVNGMVQPYLKVKRRKYRFRFLNGSTRASTRCSSPMEVAGPTQ